MKNIFTLSFMILSFLVLLGSCRSKENNTPDKPSYVKTIDSVLQVAFERELFNGNVLIAHNNEVLYEKSFGYLDASGKTPMDSESIFNIGSIAKEFNGVAIMMLVEQGKLDLEDTLDKFDLDLPEWSEKITIRHLINYAGGLPKMENFGFGITHDSIAFKEVKAIDSLLFEPGTNFNYNNNSIFLQRRIIEKVSGKTFQDFVVEHIVEPLDMSSAIFDPAPGHPNRTSCYDSEKNPCPEMQFISGWLWVTAQDLFKWTQAMNNNQLISKESLAIALRNPYAEDMASPLGEYFEEEELQRHNGTSFKYRSVLLNDFKNKVTLIFLDNNEGFALELGHVAHNIILERDFELPKKSIFLKLRKTFIEDVDKGINAYNELKQTHEDLYTFQDPDEITRLGYAVLRTEKSNAAIRTFQFGISQFPDHANLYDSLGETFLMAEDYDKALLNYKKAIALGGTGGNAKRMVKRIEQLK